MLTVGSAFRMDSLLNHMKRTQAEMTFFETQIGTGKVSQSFVDQPQSAQLVNYKASIAQREQLATNGNTVQTKLKVATTSMSLVLDTARNVSSFPAKVTAKDITAEQLRLQAVNAMKTITGALNEKAGSDFIFGGMDAKTRPVEYASAFDSEDWTADGSYFDFVDRGSANSMDPEDFSYPPVSSQAERYRDVYYQGGTGVTLGGTPATMDVATASGTTTAQVTGPMRDASTIKQDDSYQIAVLSELPPGEFQVSVTEASSGTTYTLPYSVDVNGQPLGGGSTPLEATFAGSGTTMQFSVGGVLAVGDTVDIDVQAPVVQRAGVVDDGAKVRVDRNIEVDAGFSAEEGGFEKILMGLHIMALVEPPDESLGVNDPAYQDQKEFYDGWIANAKKLIDDGISETKSTEVRAVAATVTADKAVTQTTAMIAAEHNVLSSIEDADTTTAAMAFTILETQLKASYEMTARLSTLNLTSYLR